MEIKNYWIFFSNPNVEWNGDSKNLKEFLSNNKKEIKWSLIAKKYEKIPHCGDRGIIRTVGKNTELPNGIYATVIIKEEPIVEEQRTVVKLVIEENLYDSPIYIEDIKNIEILEQERRLIKPNSWSGIKFSEEAFNKILELIVEKNFDANKYEEKIENKNLTGEEKEYLAKRRIGHSEFKILLKKTQKKCAICGIKNFEYLIASHIKPWSRADKSEKVDVENGLLLCPNHDFLFDRGLISFTENGEILISSKLSGEEKILFNINKNIKIEMSDKMKEYMRFHRENQFKK